jgi:hypothetical protein
MRLAGEMIKGYKELSILRQQSLMQRNVSYLRDKFAYYMVNWIMSKERRITSNMIKLQPQFSFAQMWHPEVLISKTFLGLFNMILALRLRSM